MKITYVSLAKGSSLFVLISIEKNKTDPWLEKMDECLTFRKTFILVENSAVINYNFFTFSNMPLPFH